MDGGMKIFFDFEFDKIGARHAPISLGMTDGTRDFYVEFPRYHDFEYTPWVQKNVLPKLKNSAQSVPVIEGRILEWTQGGVPEFWANYGAYDWYLMCELFGGLMCLPVGWPSYYNELQMLRRIKGKEEPPDLPVNSHNALDDAKWNKRLYDWCVS